MANVDFSLDLASLGRRAFAHITAAIGDGSWAVSSRIDPENLIDRVDAALSDSTFGRTPKDATLLADLADMALAAIDALEWEDAGEDVIGELNALAFLAGFIDSGSDALDSPAPLRKAVAA
jgi:hypothetical protein